MAARPTSAATANASVASSAFSFYALRHAAASLRIASGENVVSVAKQMGHDPSMCLSVYAHVFKAYEDAPRISVEDEVRKAKREEANQLAKLKAVS